ncbi:hypothetical protein [Streptomyces sp. NPDC101166]|uniref:hypothetical protein n=1 Tax=Streptomyces sp. NPDC101166 TaxID=3366120 RepID=UPI00381866AA
MKCGEPMPGSSYQACDRDLKHSGDHAYLGQRWPRPVPAGPDWGVQDFLEDAIPATAWGIEERSYPIIMTETITRVIWVDAENEDKALAYWGDDPSERPSGGEVLDGSLDFERPDNWQRQAAFEAIRCQSKIGPLVTCPGCGAEAFRREWMHNPMRKCHGPIEWRETPSKNPRFQWRREFKSTPAYDSAELAVTR